MFSSTVRADVQGLVLLRVVAEPQAVAGRHLAGIGRLHAGQQPQQGGLAGPVEPEHHDPAAPVHRDVDVGEHFQRAVGLGQVAGGQRGPPARRRLREPQPGHPLQCCARRPPRPAAAPRAAACPARPWPWSPWPASCPPGPAARPPGGARSPAPACAAARRSRAAPGTPSSPRCRSSSKLRSASRWNTLLTTASSSAVSWLITTSPPRNARRWSRSQVIESASRWLVGSSSSSVSRPREQDPGQFHPAPLAAGQRVQRLGQHPVRQAQAGRDRGGLGLGGVAAQHDQPLLQLAVPAHRRVAPGRAAPSAICASAARIPARTSSRPRADSTRSMARPSRSPARVSCGRYPMVRAAARTVPAAGSASPASTRARVVLPAPFRPTRPILSPGPIWKVASSSSSSRPRAQLQARCRDHWKPLQSRREGMSATPRATIKLRGPRNAFHGPGPLARPPHSQDTSGRASRRRD